MFAAVLFPQVLNGSLVLLLRVRGTVRRCVLSSSGSEHVLFSHPRTMCSHISTTAFFFLNELNELDELWRAVTISSFLHSGCRAGGGCGLTKRLQQQLAIITYSTI